MPLPRGFLYPMALFKKKSGRKAESDIHVCCLKFNTEGQLLLLKWGLIPAPQTLTALPKTCFLPSELFSVTFNWCFLSRLTSLNYRLNYIFSAQKTAPHFHNMTLSYLPASRFCLFVCLFPKGTLLGFGWEMQVRLPWGQNTSFLPCFLPFSIGRQPPSLCRGGRVSYPIIESGERTKQVQLSPLSLALGFTWRLEEYTPCCSK